MGPRNWRAGLAAIRQRLEVPDAFPAEVLRPPSRRRPRPRLPDLDRTDLELITIDPEGSRDLDQALHIARDGSGFVVSYAIADVAAFVTAGDPVDLEAHRRGMTLYAPDRRTPLHPPVLSEGAASLLPDQVRPALLWTITLDARGKMTDAEVVRALVRSREQLSYVQAQAEIDGGSPRETLALLAEVGPWREQRERDRGGVSLQIPEQEIVPDEPWPDGRPPGSSRTGVCCRSRAGTRRSPCSPGWRRRTSCSTARSAFCGRMPPADHGSLRRLHQTAKALGIAWPAELDYPEFVRSLDPYKPDEAAMLNACTTLFRGAGYQAFSGGVPEAAEHAALAIDYAHVTAPLRRLVDRYAGEICVALCADQPVPELGAARAGRVAGGDGGGRAAGQAVRAGDHRPGRGVPAAGRGWGRRSPGTVVEVEPDHRRGTVVINEPAIEAKVSGDDLPLGHEVRVRLAKADLDAGAVFFELA